MVVSQGVYYNNEIRHMASPHWITLIWTTVFPVSKFTHLYVPDEFSPWVIIQDLNRSSVHSRIGLLRSISRLRHKERLHHVLRPTRNQFNGRGSKNKLRRPQVLLPLSLPRAQNQSVITHHLRSINFLTRNLECLPAMPRIVSKEP